MNILNKEIKGANAEMGTHNQKIQELGIVFDGSSYKLKEKKINPKIDCAKNEITTFFGNEEKVLDIRFGVTTTDATGIKANTPVAEAETDMASYLILFDALQLVNGNLVPQSMELGNYKEKPIMLKNAIAVFFLKEFAKGLGKAVAKESFFMLFPKDKDKAIKDELNKVKEELKQFFQEIKYENLEDILVDTRLWLRDTYSESLDSYHNGEEIPFLEVYQDLKNRQTELQKITHSIQNRISGDDLKNCDYLTRNKVLLYAACAVLRIIIVKEQLFFQDLLVKNGIKGYYNTALQKEINKYAIEIKDKIEQYKVGLYDGRLEKISEKISVYNSSVTKTAAAAGGAGFYFVKERRVKWEDQFESHHRNDKFKGDKILSDKRCWIEDTKENHEDEVKAESARDLQSHTDDVIRIFKENISAPIDDTIKLLNAAKDVAIMLQ